ncbi:MAG: hypothetical protein ACWA5A_03300 [Marinibacterium sp.]
MIGQGDLQAHWQRLWLRAPGVEDTATRVHWMQYGPLYADLRVPADRPDLRGAHSLADLPADVLLSLMRAEGFAGTTTVENDTCTWKRGINWHGTPDGIDIGQLSFDGNGDLIEKGVHADYCELWRRLAAPTVAAMRVQGGRLGGVLVLSQSRFVLGIGAPGAPASAPLIAALQAGQIPAGLADHFASVYVMGSWDGSAGMAQLSTNPWNEGKTVLARTGSGFRFAGIGFDGRDQICDLAIAGSTVQAIPQSVR